MRIEPVGRLSHLLNNPVNVGNAHHKGVCHRDQHDPPSLSGCGLLRAADLPDDCSGECALLGFA